MLGTIAQIAKDLINKPATGRPAQAAEASQAPRRVQLRNSQQVASPVLPIERSLLTAISIHPENQAKPAG
jgi:hypothetical protein